MSEFWCPTQKWIVQHLDEVNPDLVPLSKTINKSTFTHKTPCCSSVLHFAALGQSPGVVLLLAKMGPSSLVNTTNLEGETPLHWACRSGNLDVIKVLLMCGANPNVIELQGNTILHYAVEPGNISVVKFLLQNQLCDPDICNVRGYSALATACEEYEFSIIKYLLLQGASIGGLVKYYTKQNKQCIVSFLSKYSRSGPSVAATTQFPSLSNTNRPRVRQR